MNIGLNSFEIFIQNSGGSLKRGDMAKKYLNLLHRLYSRRFFMRNYASLG